MTSKIVSSVEKERLRESGRKREAWGGREWRDKESVIGVMMMTSDGNRFQFPKSIIGNKSNSILELESVSWCADCGI